MENTASNSELKKFKEAIVDLYLAIKIRSTEEVFLFTFLIQISLMISVRETWRKRKRNS